MQFLGMSYFQQMKVFAFSKRKIASKSLNNTSIYVGIKMYLTRFNAFQQHMIRYYIAEIFSHFW